MLSNKTNIVTLNEVKGIGDGRFSPTHAPISFVAYGSSG